MNSKTRSSGSGPTGPQHVAHVGGLLTDQLAQGEHVLWEGSPDASRWLYPNDRILVPSSVMLGGLAILVEIKVLATSGPGSTFGELYFGALSLLGMYLLVGRLFVRRWLRARTRYAITDRRVIAVSRRLRGGVHVQSIRLDRLPPLGRRVRRDGKGSIFIGGFAPLQRELAADMSWPGFRLFYRDI